jgi:GrpB-like predicted nucleotidyltransferase (UPF0157 family)
MTASPPEPEGNEAESVWAYEPVILVDYDHGWPELAARECHQLHQLLTTWLTGTVQHVGSTAIPGMPAKPILDLQAPVDDLDSAAQIATVLTPYGWHYVPPELDQRPFRRFLVKAFDGRRVAHLHLMTVGSARWHQQLAFRDALRTNPKLIRAYSHLKHELAERYPTDREAYSAGKQQFVEQVLRRGAG